MKKYIRSSIALLLATGFALGCLACAGAPAEKKPSGASFHPNLQRYSDPEINKIIILAWQKFQDGEYESAAIDFEQLERNKYVDYDITFGAGISNFRRGNLRKAMQYLSQTLTLRPDHFEALMQRAAAFERLGSTGPSRRDYEAVLALTYGERLVCGFYFTEERSGGAWVLARRQAEARAALESKRTR